MLFWFLCSPLTVSYTINSLCYALSIRNGDGSSQRVPITCVPQTKTKTNRPSEKIRTNEEREKEESMFVTLLIIFHTLQIGVYCMGVGGGAGQQNTGWVGITW